MKHTPMIMILLLVSMTTIAQFESDKEPPVGFALTAGYAKGKYSCGVGEGFVAVRLADNLMLPDDNLILQPLSIKITSRIGDPYMPVVFATRMGYKINFLELYAGLGYSLAGQDEKREYKPYTGLKPDLGAILHLPSNWIITAGIAGVNKNKLFTVQFGKIIFK